MTTKERLYLTLDRRRVVRAGQPGAAFLLASAGAEIPKEYEPLVQAYLGADKPIPTEVTTPPPKVEETEPEEQETDEDSGPISTRVKRVPKKWSKRHA